MKGQARSLARDFKASTRRSCPPCLARDPREVEGQRRESRALQMLLTVGISKTKTRKLYASTPKAAEPARAFRERPESPPPRFRGRVARPAHGGAARSSEGPRSSCPRSRGSGTSHAGRCRKSFGCQAAEVHSRNPLTNLARKTRHYAFTVTMRVSAPRPTTRDSRAVKCTTMASFACCTASSSVRPCA